MPRAVFSTSIHPISAERAIKTASTTTTIDRHSLLTLEEASGKSRGLSRYSSRVIMFSNHHVASNLPHQRVPRRRHRATLSPSSDEADSVKQQPKPKRQRALRQFQESVKATENDLQHQLQNELLSAEPSEPEDKPESKTSYPIRSSGGAFRASAPGSRRPERRFAVTSGGDGHVDGSTLLTSNDFYAVSHLPSLPEFVRKETRASFRYVVSPSDGYCLALSHTEVLVWPYISTSRSPVHESVLRFSLPTDASKSSSILPFGTFLSHSAEDNNPGLLVILPSTGKIVLWDTVSHAAAFVGLATARANRFNGVHGSIPGLMSGEYVTDIANAEPSGVVASLSTGRIAHISTRDVHGKPSVSVHLPRTASGPFGLLSGIKNAVLGSVPQRNLVALRPGVSVQRGQRDVALATDEGELEIWDTRWHQPPTLKVKTDLRRAMLSVLRSDQSLNFGLANPEELYASFHLWDLAFCPGLEPPSEHPSANMFYALVSVTYNSHTSYFVIQAGISSQETMVGQVSSVNYRDSSATATDASCAPRLHIPKPYETAFIVFEQTVVLLSLLPDGLRFEEAIRLQKDKNCSIQSSGLIESDVVDQRPPSCVLMVRGYGVLRITALPLAGIETMKISVKSRIEQAVFFGNVKTNPLDLNTYHLTESYPGELESSAIEISDEILSSSARFISKSITNLDHQLKFRAVALHDLGLYLQRHNVRLSYPARWRLLWGAEKLAAQRALWNLQKVNRMSVTPEGHPRKVRLEDVIEQLYAQKKSSVSVKSEDSDLLHDWFVHDTWQIENIVPLLLSGIRGDRKTGPKLDQNFPTLLCDAMSLSLAIFQTAFEFREENLALYGLQRMPFVGDQGDIDARFESIPEFWTSNPVNYEETEQLLDLALNSCIKWTRLSRDAIVFPSAPDLRLIKQNISREFRVFALMHSERVRWCAAQKEPDFQENGKVLQIEHTKRRKEQLFKMGGIDGLLEDAISLAEHMKDMESLFSLLNVMHERIFDGEDNDSKYTLNAAKEDAVNDLHRRINSYFDKFGDDWSNAFFSRHIQRGQPGHLLSATEYRKPFTRFLRSRPQYAKISWINDIHENDYRHASQTLKDLANDDEEASDPWCKETMLALGKLSLLADLEKTGTDVAAETHADVKQFDELLEPFTASPELSPSLM